VSGYPRDKIQHLIRLNLDAVDLLRRCFDEGELPPDLCVDVGTLLLRLDQARAEIDAEP
jgi:hypothetical protein